MYNGIVDLTDMRPEVRDEWLEALESGKYRQHIGTLANRDRTAHCCLGVLSELAVKSDVIETYDPYLPLPNNDVIAWAFGTLVQVSWTYDSKIDQTGSHNDVDKLCDNSVTYMNDHGGSFADIAKGLRLRLLRMEVEG